MNPSSERQRPFRLAELMGLVAAFGPALAMTRSYLRCFSVLEGLVSTEPGNVRVMGVREWLYAGVPLLVVLSLVLLPLRLSRGGGRFRRFARLPGLTASYASAAALVFALVRAVIDQYGWHGLTHYPGVGSLTLTDTLALRFVAMKDMIGSGVFVTWLIIGLGGGWRPEPTWIDRLGRLLGAFWIVFGLALWVDWIVWR